MKKSLFAAAALSAIAGAAQAQSSVTVYGILDVGYIGTSQSLPPTGASLASTATTVPYKIQQNTLGASAESTSRLGFKGNEDLGGGNSAFFTVEMQLYPQDATLGGSTSYSGLQTGTSANSIGGMLNRQTFVGLKRNGIGQAAIGTQYTPIHNAVGQISAAQQDNLVGSVLYAGNGSGTSSAGYTVRTDNAITATTDNFAGFTLTGLYAMNNQNRTLLTAGSTNATAGGTTNINGWGIGLNYQWKKLFLTANFQNFKNQNNGTSSGGINQLPSGTSVPNNGSNLTDNQTVAGATYDFGILKGYAGWTGRKATSTLDSSNYLNRTGQEIGVRSYVTPVIEAWANIGNGRYQAFGNGLPTANFNSFQIGSNYYLSKRTNLYGIFGKTQTSSTSATSSADYFPAGMAGSISQYAVGVRHTF